MELAGLIQLFEYWESLGLDVKAIITDRHRSIAKWLRINQKDVLHIFDLWHLAKGKCKGPLHHQSQVPCAECRVTIECPSSDLRVMSRNGHWTLGTRNRMGLVV